MRLKAPFKRKVSDGPPNSTSARSKDFPPYIAFQQLDSFLRSAHSESLSGSPSVKGKQKAEPYKSIPLVILAFDEAHTDSTKILELEDELSAQLRNLIAGREDIYIETTTFSEDEVLALSVWCMRLSVLAGTRNMTTWIEEDEGRKQSSAWDIVSALVERGRLGYKEETVCDASYSNC